MRNLFFLFVVAGFITACENPREKWVRYVSDTAGIANDTMNIIFYEDKIVLEAIGPWNWTGKKHSDIFTYEILDKISLPEDPRKTLYRLKADNGNELLFRVYRIEKGRAAINFSDLEYNPSFTGEPVPVKFDTISASQALKETAWQSPLFFSDSLAEKLKGLRGLVSANCDSTTWYFKLRCDYVKQHKARFVKWGEAGTNYMYEEPGAAALESLGYNPWRVYSQLQSVCFDPDDSANAGINREYRELLNGINNR